MIENRYDFLMLCDVHDGNPNGDPDMQNMPRLDPDTGHGLITDVCLKRKVRNYAAENGEKLYIENLEGSLNSKDEDAAKAVGVKLDKKGTKDAGKVIQEMCSRYFDMRVFGAVVTSLSGTAFGGIRGPVQFSMSRSLDPVSAMRLSITRMAVNDEAWKNGDRNKMGEKFIVPYGLYRGYGFVSPHLSEKTGMTADDLYFLMQALFGMFDLDHSAARGFMTMQKVVVFKHNGKYGRYSADELFRLVSVKRMMDIPMSFQDYEVSVQPCPAGVEVRELNCFSDVEKVRDWLV